MLAQSLAVFASACLSFASLQGMSSSNLIAESIGDEITAGASSADSAQDVVTIEGTRYSEGSSGIESLLGFGGDSSVVPDPTVESEWCTIQRLSCVPWAPPGGDESTPVTMSDIATFRPITPTAAMQPNLWMVVGLDTNFYAHTSQHTVDGTLFGGTAQVRFTPVEYHWSYGDGNTATHTRAGTTWAKQKITEFDPTPTSHVYEESGDYTITLTVTYTAEYRVADARWKTVHGTLNLDAAPLETTAVHATTVLVNQDCHQNPHGIGC